MTHLQNDDDVYLNRPTTQSPLIITTIIYYAMQNTLYLGRYSYLLNVFRKLWLYVFY